MSAIKTRLYGLALRVIRLDRSRRLEKRAISTFLRFRPNHLTALRKWAEYSEAAGNQWDAIAAWQRISDQTEFSNTRKFLKAQSRISSLIRTLNHDRPGSLSPRDAVPVDSALHPSDVSVPNVSLKFHAEGENEALLEKLKGLMYKHERSTLRADQVVSIVDKLNQGEYDAAEVDLMALLEAWPGDRVSHRLLYKLHLTRILQNLDPGYQRHARWWVFFEAHLDTLPSAVILDVRNLMARYARVLFRDGRLDEAEAVVLPVSRLWPDDEFALRMLARVAEQRNDWRAAVGYWQFLAAVKNPITTKNRAVVARSPETLLKISKAALRELRNARTHLAAELLAQGKLREFSELVSRVVESVPDQRILKKDRSIIDIVRAYAEQAMLDDGVTMRPISGNPKKIVMCLDVMKISDIHTHSRILFAMSKNLLQLDEEIEVFIVIANERFTVTLPALAPSFTRSNESKLRELAAEAMGSHYGTRFHISYFRRNGLEGLIENCKEILALQPDVILYGGGHRGLFSNESRLVRHCLFDHVPTAFFYIQSNNEVDDKIDMIIARGPHEIVGEIGDATVRIQPYPTIVEEFIPPAPRDEDAAVTGKTIVSALAGVRMDFKLSALDDGTLRELLSILDDSPGTVWHIIGASNPRKLVTDNPTLAKRVLSRQVVVHPVLPFDQFTEIVGKSTLFLHLPGFTGGSGGASVARRNGIPILTFSHSDVSGRQPPVTVFEEGDIAGYSAMAKKLVNDEAERQRVVDLQFQHTTWIRETSAQGFYDCLNEAVRLYQQRRSGHINVDFGGAVAVDQHALAAAP